MVEALSGDFSISDVLALSSTGRRLKKSEKEEMDRVARKSKSDPKKMALQNSRLLSAEMILLANEAN